MYSIICCIIIRTAHAAADGEFRFRSRERGFRKIFTLYYYIIVTLYRGTDGRLRHALACV